MLDVQFLSMTLRTNLLVEVGSGKQNALFYSCSIGTIGCLYHMLGTLESSFMVLTELFLADHVKKWKSS